MDKIGGGFQKPPDDVMALSTMLCEWLRGVIIDPDTSIDTGGGFGQRDLWFWMGGEEIRMQIKPTGRSHNQAQIGGALRRQTGETNDPGTNDET